MTQIVQLFVQAFQGLLHLDVHLNEGIKYLGPNIYGLLTLVIFCETGLVVTPFLPGDSLLFALGALSAGDHPALKFTLLLGLLCPAAIVGDAVNYAIGRKIGPKVFKSETSVLFNRKHLARTQAFYEKYGAKTVLFARFLPIIRTFAPFVAGIGQMNYPKFAFYNVLGGVTWVGCFLGAGYLFGNLPSVKSNFHYVILAIIVLSMIPGLLEYARIRKESKRQALSTS